MFSDAPMSRSCVQGIHETSSTQNHVLGELRITPDGRKFRYAKAGGSDLTAGHMCVAPDLVANHIECNVTATAIGEKTVNVTPGATTGAANYYKDGYLQVNKGTGAGHSYAIESHPAIAASTAFNVKLKDPIKVALVAAGTSEVSLIPSPFMATATTTDEENLPVGIAPVAVTTGYYYWSQTGGLACAQIDAGAACSIGAYLILSTNHAGLLEIRVTALDVDEPALGILMAQTGVDNEWAPVWLLID